MPRRIWPPPTPAPPASPWPSSESPPHVKIEKSFDLARPRQIVWEAFGDVHLVAACLPGASIAEELGDGHYKGKFSIKLGPMAAAFAGDVTIERRPEEWTAV